MKILIISDSHGNRKVIDEALRKESDADITVHAGDGWEDIREDEVRRLISVPGNCDRGASGERIRFFEAGGVRFMLTHGDAFRVSYGTGRLVREARERGCDAVIFGHTHRSLISEEDGIILINPGTSSRSRSMDGKYGYAVAEAAGGRIISAEIICL